MNLCYSNIDWLITYITVNSVIHSAICRGLFFLIFFFVSQWMSVEQAVHQCGPGQTVWLKECGHMWPRSPLNVSWGSHLHFEPSACDWITHDTLLCMNRADYTNKMQGNRTVICPKMHEDVFLYVSLVWCLDRHSHCSHISYLSHISAISRVRWRLLMFNESQNCHIFNFWHQLILNLKVFETALWLLLAYEQCR